MRFDSVREITASLQAEARKLQHLGICMMTSKAHWLMRINDDQRLYLRLYEDICMPPITIVFRQTDDVLSKRASMDEKNADNRLNHHLLILHLLVSNKKYSHYSDVNLRKNTLKQVLWEQIMLMRFAK